MSRCKVGEIWNSRLNGQPDGQFHIDQIDAHGNFTGRHGGDVINGRCAGGSIYYTRSGKGHYHGAYQPGDEEVRGTHSAVALLEKRKVLPDDDEWVGTHT